MSSKRQILTDIDEVLDTHANWEADNKSIATWTIFRLFIDHMQGIVSSTKVLSSYQQANDGAQQFKKALQDKLNAISEEVS